MADDLSTEALIEQIRNGDFSGANSAALSLLDRARSVSLNPLLL